MLWILMYGKTHTWGDDSRENFHCKANNLTHLWLHLIFIQVLLRKKLQHKMLLFHLIFQLLFHLQINLLVLAALLFELSFPIEFCWGYMCKKNKSNLLGQMIWKCLNTYFHFLDPLNYYLWIAWWPLFTLLCKSYAPLIMQLFSFW